MAASRMALPHQRWLCRISDGRSASATAASHWRECRAGDGGTVTASGTLAEGGGDEGGEGGFEDCSNYS
jgi:hypothetical protein